MTPTDPAVIGKWLAWISTIGGAITFVAGWRARGRTGELIAPAGAMGIIGGVSHFLWGVVPDAILIAADLTAMVLLTVWAVRLHKASRARVSELRKSRASGTP